MFKKNTSLKLSVRATFIAQKMQISFCQDSWQNIGERTPLRVQGKSSSNSSARMLAETTHVTEFEYYIIYNHFERHSRGYSNLTGSDLRKLPRHVKQQRTVVVVSVLVTSCSMLFLPVLYCVHCRWTCCWNCKNPRCLRASTAGTAFSLTWPHLSPTRSSQVDLFRHKQTAGKLRSALKSAAYCSSVHLLLTRL